MPWANVVLVFGRTRSVVVIVVSALSRWPLRIVELLYIYPFAQPLVNGTVQIEIVHYSPCSLRFVWLIRHNRKYCWLIWCERKIMFVGWKSMAYKPNKSKQKEWLSVEGIAKGPTNLTCWRTRRPLLSNTCLFICTIEYYVAVLSWWRNKPQKRSFFFWQGHSYKEHEGQLWTCDRTTSEPREPLRSRRRVRRFFAAAGCCSHGVTCDKWPDHTSNQGLV